MALSFNPCAARIVTAGPVASFGGPNDATIRPGDELSLYDTSDNDDYGLFLPGGVGQAARLDPSAAYCALRWTGKGISYRSARQTLALVRHNDSGRQIILHLVDAGPPEYSGRLVDISPAAMQALGAVQDDIVTLVWPYSPKAANGQ